MAAETRDDGEVVLVFDVLGSDADWWGWQVMGIDASGTGRWMRRGRCGADCNLPSECWSGDLENVWYA
jgi:hypothetical protein